MRRQSCRVDHIDQLRECVRQINAITISFLSFLPSPLHRPDVSFISSSLRQRGGGSWIFSVQVVRETRGSNGWHILLLIISGFVSLIVVASLGDPLNMHRPGEPGFACASRDMALRFIGSIICTVLISRRIRLPVASCLFDRARIRHTLETLRNFEVCRSSFIQRRD